MTDFHALGKIALAAHWLGQAGCVTSVYCGVGGTVTVYITREAHHEFFHDDACTLEDGLTGQVFRHHTDGEITYIALEREALEGAA